MSKPSPSLGIALAAFFGGVALCVVLGSWLGNPFVGEGPHSIGSGNGGASGERRSGGTATEERLLATLDHLVEGLRKVEGALGKLDGSRRPEGGQSLSSDRRAMPSPSDGSGEAPSEEEELLEAVQELTKAVRALQTRGNPGGLAVIERRDPGVFGRDALLDSVKLADERDLEHAFAQDYYFWTPAEVVERFGQPDNIWGRDGVLKVQYDLVDPETEEGDDVSFHFFDGSCIGVYF